MKEFFPTNRAGDIVKILKIPFLFFFEVMFAPRDLKICWLITLAMLNMPQFFYPDWAYFWPSYPSPFQCNAKSNKVEKLFFFIFFLYYKKVY